jgi:putative inorganic carbon (hco3(-)) transporter
LRGKWGERLFAAGVFFLPLVCWPGLDHPFSTPKMWLLGCLDVGLAVRYLLLRQKPRAGDWPWLLWLGCVGLSAALAPYVSLEALLLILLPAPLCWAVRHSERALVLGSLVESAIVVLQYLNLDPLRWLGWQPEIFASSRMRVYGTLGNPDFVAAWLCATLPLYAGLRRNRYAKAALVFQLAAILATGSRVFLLALPVAAVILVLREGRLWKWWLVGLPVAAALLLISPARPLGVTLQGRLNLAGVTASHWREIPLLGHGPGSFETLFPPLDHAHNDYLELWVEYGPLGLCAFLLLCGWLMAEAWRVSPGSAPGAWAGLASLLAVACVDFPLHRPAEWGLYWLLIGIVGKGDAEDVHYDEADDVDGSARSVGVRPDSRGDLSLSGEGRGDSQRLPGTAADAGRD